MTKTILVTGSTDDIDVLTAKKLAADGHKVPLHGRGLSRLESAAGGDVETTAAAPDKAHAADVMTTMKGLINQTG